MTLEPRPKRYPPPEFPPRRAKLFARMPPAVFPSILGLLGLVIALRVAFGRAGWNQGPVDLLAGLSVALWLFAAFAYLSKIGQRRGVVAEDLRVLPGRSGLAAMTMGGMASATLVAPYAPDTAWALMVMGLLGHLALAWRLVRLLLALPEESRGVNPTLHLSFVGVIVAAPVALALGWVWLATALFWITLAVALVIWWLSAVQFLREVPPAPLRPLLAIHVAPAALLATVAALLGLDGLATLFVAIASGLAVALALSARWLCAAGISPLWGAFTFPLAALATAMLVVGGPWAVGGGVLAVVGLGAIPAIAWWVLKRWPGGRLAAVTNAAEA